MSTKEYIRRHENDGDQPGWQLYTEMFEAESIYLQLEGIEAEITMTGNMNRAPGTVLLCLPVATAKQLGLVPGDWKNAWEHVADELFQLRALKGVVRHEGEAVSIEEMNAASGPPPSSHWNYRVMEFSEGNETWREFREVYYRDGQPEHYAAVGDSPRWGDNEEARLILDQMRVALDKPILRPSDFPH